jgi:hypothetical protein
MRRITPLGCAAAKRLKRTPWLRFSGLRARRIVLSEPWCDQIRAVAEALLQRRTLSGAEARDLVRKVFGPTLRK